MPNRHQRRASAAKRQDHQQWVRGVHQVHQEAAGLLEITVVQPTEITSLLAALDQGGRAGKMAALVMRTIVDVHEAPAAEPKLCMTCCRPMTLHIPCSVVLAIPSRVDPTKCLSGVVCAACGTDPAVVQGKAIDALRGTWPDLRPITISGQAGHA